MKSLAARSAEGKLQPDPVRFPSGIPALAEYVHKVLHCTVLYCTVLYCTVLYVHKLGLKFGIYEDYGNFTCGGYPGVLGHMQVSAGMVMTRAANEGSREFLGPSNC